MANYSTKPSIYEAVGNGSYLYRYNIKEVKPKEQEKPAKEGETQEPAKSTWECSEVTVFAPVTANKITEAVVNAEWEPNYEQKLINEYNGAQMGLYGGSPTSKEAKAKIAKYKDFLVQRTAIKTEVDANCKDLGIF